MKKTQLQSKLGDYNTYGSGRYEKNVENVISGRIRARDLPENVIVNVQQTVC